MKTIVCFEAIVSDSGERLQGFFYASGIDGVDDQCRAHALAYYGKVCDSVIVAYLNQFLTGAGIPS